MVFSFPSDLFNSLVFRDKRYFRIKNGVLYWYLNERSRESQNKINFSDVDEVLTDPKPKKKTKFSMVNNFSPFDNLINNSETEIGKWKSIPFFGGQLSFAG